MNIEITILTPALNKKNNIYYLYEQLMNVLLVK